MRIKIELPGEKELPSQGRNSGSIPDESASALPRPKKIPPSWLHGTCFDATAPAGLVEGRYYRIWRDPDSENPEFVYFVGWAASRDALIFEDGAGDLLMASVAQIETRAAP